MKNNFAYFCRFDKSFFFKLNLQHDDEIDDILPGEEVTPLKTTAQDSANQSMGKQPVSLYRHTVADICILVNPSTKQIIPQQSAQVLEYMQTNHAQDSIQSLINNKILVLVCGNSVSTRASLVSVDKTPLKDPKIESDNLGKSSITNYKNICIVLYL